jgi:hypothetical protein
MFEQSLFTATTGEHESMLSRLAHMKNFMPILSKKSVDSLTFTMSLHQHRAASIPSGKLAYFIFFGLRPWSEQGKLIATKLNDTSKIAVQMTG